MVVLPAPLFIVPTPADVKPFFNMLEIRDYTRARRPALTALSAVSPQNDNVLFAQSRNVLLTPFRLGRWQKDNY